MVRGVPNKRNPAGLEVSRLLACRDSGSNGQRSVGRSAKNSHVAVGYTEHEIPPSGAQ